MKFVDKDIKQLVEGGQIFDAIHLFRKRYRMGLNDAKSYIDAIKTSDKASLKTLHETYHIEEKREQQEELLDVDPDILNAIHDNDKMTAIKICLERYPMDAIRAKKYIDAIICLDKDLVEQFGPNAENNIPGTSGGGAPPESEATTSLEHQEVLHLLRDGQDLKAIHFYKDRHQVDMAEAKEVIHVLKERYLMQP